MCNVMCLKNLVIRGDKTSHFIFMSQRTMKGIVIIVVFACHAKSSSYQTKAFIVGKEHLHFFEIFSFDSRRASLWVTILFSSASRIFFLVSVYRNHSNRSKRFVIRNDFRLLRKATRKHNKRRTEETFIFVFLLPQ